VHNDEAGARVVTGQRRSALTRPSGVGGFTIGSLLIIMTGCTGADDVPSGLDEACAATPAFIFYGSTDAGALSLGSRQSNAIAGLTAGEGGMPVCTATVIGDGFAVSAAHCLQFGTLSLLPGEPGASLATRNHVVHPELDVVLFEFERQGELGILPIPLLLDPVGVEWEGMEATLAGVGYTEAGSSGELRFARERIVAVTANEIWVEGMGETGACGGDSGGPLLVEDSHGAVRALGVLTRGAASCVGVDVYARADLIVSWLREVNDDVLPTPPPAACR
jgi:hypothetical protein